MEKMKGRSSKNKKGGKGKGSRVRPIRPSMKMRMMMNNCAKFEGEEYKICKQKAMEKMKGRSSKNKKGGKGKGSRVRPNRPSMRLMMNNCAKFEGDEHKIC